MSKDSSPKYYQSNKEKLQKSLSNEERNKSDNMVVKDTKIYQKMKSKSLLSIEKNLIKSEKKHFIMILRRYFPLENLQLS